MQIIDDQLCTVIPLYKKEYFVQTIRSLMAQTVIPRELWISDDSPSGFLINDHNLQSDIIRCLVGVQVHYLQGPKIGALSNIRQLLTAANQNNKYVHIFLDDDLIWPTFYHRHLSCLRESKAECSISLRFVIDEAGIPLGSPSIPKIIESSKEKYIFLDYTLIAQSAIQYLNNWLGELSNSVFELASLLDLWDSPAKFRAQGLEDIGSFAIYARRNAAILLCENLSCFRISSSQNTEKKESDAWKAAILGWIPLSEMALKDGVLTLDEHYRCVSQVTQLFNEHFRVNDPFSAICLAEYLDSGARNSSIFSILWIRFLEGAKDYRA